MVIQRRPARLAAVLLSPRAVCLPFDLVMLRAGAGLDLGSLPLSFWEEAVELKLVRLSLFPSSTLRTRLAKLREQCVSSASASVWLTP